MARHRKTLLWKIIDEGVNTPSFLFGSMHVRNQQLINKCAALVPFMKQCGVFASEMDINDLKRVSYDQLLDTQDNLHNHLSPKKYHKLRKIILKSFGLDIAFYNQMPPMMTLQLITESLLTTDAQISLDEFLWNCAIELDLRCTGIETLEDQLLVMRSIPWSYQVKALKSVAKNVRKFRKEVLKTVNYYMEEDIDQLFRTTKKQLGDIRHLMVYQRNKRMAEAIGMLCKAGSSFVAIGAAHLSGGKGVLRILKQNGFKIYPVLDWSIPKKEKSADTLSWV